MVSDDPSYSILLELSRTSKNSRYFPVSAVSFTASFISN
ncbi:hypothetical protein HMPREF1051_0901 [Neisseria sicca VK64]|uniref:Uncharacterized protein n=1 Tax=Neisseria sicca VK64 TaxID=1095748 RepID=I2NTF6_NEISI|nr:hypothetical protein HMPREF1051_0901 [Neisseria sicca VK64]